MKQEWVFLKNYFFVFVLGYGIVVSTKFLFLAVHTQSFIAYPLIQQIEAVMWGYRFDLAVSAAMAFAATLLDFHRRSLRIAAAAFLSLLAYLQFADMIYFSEAQRHVSYEARDFFVDAGELILTAFTEQPYLFATGVLLNVALFLTIYRMRGGMQSVVPDRLYLFKKLFLAALTVFFVRGMFVHIPLNPWQASQIGDPQLAKLALNGAYSTVFAAIRGENGVLRPVELPSMSEAKMRQHIGELYKPSDLRDHRVWFDTKPNVVLIFLESWPANQMASYGYPIVTTPRFDALLERSIRPRAMMASGHRTTEGIFAALASYPNPLGETVAKTQLQSYDYQSIIRVLHDAGYHSAFFQGSSKETSGTGSFAQSLGFRESYGKEDVTRRQYGENYWGVYDQDLYAFVESKVGVYTEPFVIGINTNTTHSSTVPPQIPAVQYTDDPKRNARLNVLRFADQALGEFIERFEKRHPNTLFVLFSDHTAGVTESLFENYLIPFAIYSPRIEPRRYDVIISQRDMAPTVLDLLGFDYRIHAAAFTGKSLIRDRHFFADFYADGALGWVEGRYYSQFDFSTGQKECFDVSTLKPRKIACPPGEKGRYERALAFTRKTQELLFRGDTSLFSVLRP